MSARLPLLALLLLLVTVPASAKPKLKESATVDDRPADRAERSAEAAPLNEEGLIAVDGAGGPHVGHHEPRHGGALIPLGRAHAHLELLVDPEDGQVTLWITDGKAEEPIRIGGNMLLVRFEALGDQIPLPLFPQPDGLDSDAPGSSQWGAAHRRLVGLTKMSGVIEGIAIQRRAYRKIPFTYPEGTEGVAP